MAWVTSSKRQRDKSLCSQFKHWELVSFPWAEVKWKKNKTGWEREDWMGRLTLGGFVLVSDCTVKCPGGYSRLISVSITLSSCWHWCVAYLRARWGSSVLWMCIMTKCCVFLKKNAITHIYKHACFHLMHENTWLVNTLCTFLFLTHAVLSTDGRSALTHTHPCTLNNRDIVRVY